MVENRARLRNTTHSKKSKVPRSAAKASCIRARFLCVTFGCASKIRFLRRNGETMMYSADTSRYRRAHLILINYRGFLRSRANASVRANCKRLIVSTRKNPRNARTNRWRTWKLHSSILLLCHVSTGNSTRSCSMADNLCLTRKQSACRLFRLYMFYRYVYVYRYMFIDIYTYIHIHISLLVIVNNASSL